MTKSAFVSSDVIRAMFSAAMSEMYRSEVPQYGALTALVADINGKVLAENPELETRLREADELDRLGVERHGAIRVGTPAELSSLRRLFAVMGMVPVGYYDLSVAGVPVQSTAFRPIDEAALRRNPFRVFTSLLRLDWIDEAELRREAAAILARRSILSARCRELLDLFEKKGGLDESQSREFVSEALETFRWRGEASVSAEVYHRLRKVHPLIADVVGFKGPHINHLTPRTLDIDAAQLAMAARGMNPKAIIEGPPRRTRAILLRQTSFKALEEPIAFQSVNGAPEAGTHAARFGEIEQRGMALTAEGRALYDRLLAAARATAHVGGTGSGVAAFTEELGRQFDAFPDDDATLHREKLAFFRYSPTAEGSSHAGSTSLPRTVEGLLRAGYIQIEPIVYEDFLPVSAAGIFHSNLDHDDLGRNPSKSLERDAGGKPGPTFPHPARDHDDFGSNRSKVMNVIESNSSERDAGGKPGPTFPDPALGDAEPRKIAPHADRGAFEAALEGEVVDELALYAEIEARSRAACLKALGLGVEPEPRGVRSPDGAAQ